MSESGVEGGGKVGCVLFDVKYTHFRFCVVLIYCFLYCVCFVMSFECSCLGGMFLPHGTADGN